MNERTMAALQAGERVRVALQAELAAGAGMREAICSALAEGRISAEEASTCLDFWDKLIEPEPEQGPG